ncbi:MAG TPA: hemolysin family protein [Gemmatimonadales bacterium]|jgi:CBS domain containing-hemolysin-like protein|nr:hemolysin family protein [Gemmatimonadales bacterium]
MMAMLQLFIAPLLAVGLTLWAAWLAFAAESDADLPRALGGELSNGVGAGTLSRNLHVAHLALLVLAGAAAGGAVAWWARGPAGGLIRLTLAVALVWVVGDLLPRLLAAVAPELTGPARRAAAATLGPFRLMLRLAAWADTRARAATPDTPRHTGPAERDMLLGVFSLAETTVAEVMTPRIDVIAVDSSADREEVTDTLRSSEHARLLVYDGHPDAIAGVIYAKDILAASLVDDAPWQSLIRPAAFVPEGKALDRQLRDFQRGPSHLAVVVDEFGGTAGLVTLEDILEQIVGEIQDERDVDEVAPIQVVAEDQLRVEGGVALSELEGILGHRFEREDVSTVGGLVLAEFGRVPRTGEVIDLQGYRLVVEQVIRRRVRRVAVFRPAVESSLDTAERALP